ncbi:MAG: PIN domain-containing protein [Atopobiaceae bacterium]|nr:PIN domain-containing protein [Atopobiaceae bacterium]
MRLYLDNCCYNRPYDDQSTTTVSLEAQAKLKVQEMIQEGEIELVSSFMLWYELGQNPYLMRRRAIERFLREHTFLFVEADAEGLIRQNAQKIMDAGVKPKDAYHVACALHAGCDSFLTTDRRLLKYRCNEMLLENPIDFVRRMEEV